MSKIMAIKMIIPRSNPVFGNPLLKQSSTGVSEYPWMGELSQYCAAPVSAILYLPWFIFTLVDLDSNQDSKLQRLLSCR